MFKKNKSEKKAMKAMLKEGLLCEGGGLNANDLAKLNKDTNINCSDNSDYNGSVRKSKSKFSDSTHIAGLENFNKYGDLF